jgi:hypothetical protein
MPGKADLGLDLSEGTLWPRKHGPRRYPIVAIRSAAVADDGLRLARMWNRPGMVLGHTTAGESLIGIQGPARRLGHGMPHATKKNHIKNQNNCCLAVSEKERLGSIPNKGLLKSDVLNHYVHNTVQRNYAKVVTWHVDGGSR